MITTVIFDLDDTLYPEIEYCKSGFRAVAEYLWESQGLDSEQAFGAFWREFMEGDRSAVFNNALKNLDIPYTGNFIGRLVEVYRCHEPKIGLVGETRLMLDQLAEKYTLALLTDGFLPAQKLKVQSLGIEKYFRCIIYTEELGRDFWKPSTAGFEKMLKILGEKAENCVYVADNEQKDFIATNKLGMKTIKLTFPGQVHTQNFDHPEHKAGIEIDGIGSLTEVLSRL
ncbi:MAG: HAD family hydrolase [Phycisphaerae bacterium]|nr:HAD family hydrolase [Phycisphaerae bacterium]